jgi:hypothetical protein
MKAERNFENIGRASLHTNIVLSMSKFYDVIFKCVKDSMQHKIILQPLLNSYFFMIKQNTVGRGSKMKI